MKTLLILPLLALAGCATAVKPISVAKVAAPIEQADVIAVQSRARVQKIQTKVTTAKEAVATLKKTSTPVQKPAVEVVEQSLNETSLLLIEEMESKRVLEEVLADARKGLTDLKGEMDTQTRMLEAAQVKVKAYHSLRMKVALVFSVIAMIATFHFLPSILGPYKWWAIGGAGAVAFGTTLLIL